MSYVNKIFSDEKGKYWKVLSDKTHNGYMSCTQYYDCISCTKSGLEYINTNGFSVSRLDFKHSQGKLMESQHPLGAKVGAGGNGAEVGKLKRRANHLKQKIAAMQLELNTIQDALGLGRE